MDTLCDVSDLDQLHGQIYVKSGEQLQIYGKMYRAKVDIPHETWLELVALSPRDARFATYFDPL